MVWSMENSPCDELVTLVHELPSQCSMKGSGPPWLPTAHTSSDAIALTPSKNESAGGLCTLVWVHASPSQCRSRGVNGGPQFPTAHASSTATAATSYKNDS